MTTRVDVITRAETPVSLGEMMIAFRHCLPVVEQRQGTLEIAPDIELLTILTADVLQSPVQSVEMVKCVGRFALVQYAPVYDADPDVILFCGVGGQGFHKAMRDFQRARRRGRVGLSEWYRRTKAAARGLITPLGALDPSPSEADLVLRWALGVCARHKTT